MARDVSYIIKAVDQFSGVAKRVEQSIENINKSLKKTEKKSMAFSREFRKAGGTLFKAFTLPITAAGGFALKMFSDFQNLNTLLNTTIGNTKHTAVVMTGLESIAKRGFSNMSELGGAAAGLINARVAASEVTGVLTKLSNIAAGTGQKINDLAGFYAKVKKAGKLTSGDAGDLEKFGLTGEVLAKFKIRGKAINTKQLEKALESGAISFKQFGLLIDAVTSKQGKFANGLTSNSKTISGAMNALKNTTVIAFSKLGNEINNTFDISGKLQKAGKYVSDLDSKFKDFVKNNPGLVKFAIKLSAVLAAIAPLLLAMGAFAGAVSAIGVVIKVAILPFAALVKIISSAVAIIKAVNVAFWFLAANPVVLIIGAIVAAIAALIYLFIRFKPQIISFFKALKVPDWVKASIEALIWPFKKLYDSIMVIKDAIKSLFSSEAFSSFGNKVADIGAKIRENQGGENSPFAIKNTNRFIASGENKSSAEITLNIKDPGEKVESVVSKAAAFSKFPIGINMKQAY